MILQIVQGIKTIHAKGDVHFDLKLDNMRANFDFDDPESVEAVIVDFDRMCCRIDPITWILAEARAHFHYSFRKLPVDIQALKFDIWALALALNQIYYRHDPQRPNLYYYQPISPRVTYQKWKQEHELQPEENTIAAVITEMCFYMNPDIDSYFQKLKECRNEIEKDQLKWENAKREKMIDYRSFRVFSSAIQGSQEVKQKTNKLVEIREKIFRDFFPMASLGDPEAQFKMYLYSPEEKDKLIWLSAATANGHEDAAEILEQTGRLPIVRHNDPSNPRFWD